MSSRGFCEDSIQSLPKAQAFVSSRIGIDFRRFNEDLASLLEDYQIGNEAHFIITPIISPRGAIYNIEDGPLDALPDLVIDQKSWQTSIAVSINHLSLDSGDEKALRAFDLLFRHALYLPTPVIVIECPDSERACQLVASVVNNRLRNRYIRPHVLIRVHIGERLRFPQTSQNNNQNQVFQPDATMEVETESDESGRDSCSEQSSPSNDFEQKQISNTRPWNNWNRLRNHLTPDTRIGLCLEFTTTFEEDTVELHKWVGEPVRMCILGDDLFLKTPRCSGVRVQTRFKQFLRSLMVSNSMKTSLVLQEVHDRQELCERIKCLKTSLDDLEKDHHDSCRAWNDLLMIPLQPLSCNLDSETYRVFETDLAKYENYQRAMSLALDAKIQSTAKDDKIVVMILGAGRGPLVDALLKALKTKAPARRRYKVYALDKNLSSVQSLLFKKRMHWDKLMNQDIETQIVQADMRVWNPEERPDIIASELLGSFSDNELSPECIDGTWRFATKDTISVPQAYSSHIAPISSYYLHQQLCSETQLQPFDMILVCRLSNYYAIDKAKELFAFEHIDLSIESKPGANERTKKLRFKSTTDTVCHGFAGYFSARLYGEVSISTVPEDKTTGMESWFPVFIPLEKPIQMLKNTNIEVEFKRRDSPTKVWYEWVVTEPETSRVHSTEGADRAMSKVTEF